MALFAATVIWIRSGKWTDELWLPVQIIPGNFPIQPKSVTGKSRTTRGHLSPDVEKERRILPSECEWEGEIHKLWVVSERMRLVYKGLKWNSYSGCLSSGLGIVWGARTTGKTSEWKCCTSLFNGTVWRALAPPGLDLLGEIFQAFQILKTQGQAQQVGGITPSRWRDPPIRERGCGLEGCLALPCLSFCYCVLDLD